MAAKDILITAGLDLGGIGSDINELTGTLTKLDRSLYGTTFSSADQATQAFRNFSGAVLNTAESVPLLGGVIKSLTSPIADNFKDINDLNLALTTQAENYDQLTSKFAKLEELRAHARANDNNSGGAFAKILNRVAGTHIDERGKLQYEEEQIGKELTIISEKYTHAVEDETEALKNYNVESIRKVRLAKIDMEAQAQIAATAQRLKNPVGELSPQAQKILNAEAKRILAEAENNKTALELKLRKESGERDINNILATRGITLEDELRVNLKVQSSLEYQLQLLIDKKQENSVYASQLRAQIHETALQYEQILYIKDKEALIAKNNNETIAAQLTGNRAIASEAEIRAKYEVQIADALRRGNKELADQLQLSERLETLKARAAYDLMTPGERRAERNQARKLGRALQREISRDKIKQAQDDKAGEQSIRDADYEIRHGGHAPAPAPVSPQGPYGRVSNRDYVPISTQRALSAAGASAPKVGTLQVSILNVETIKTK